MIQIDDTYPDEVLKPCFPVRDVSIKRGVDAKIYFDLLDEIGRGKFGTVYKCKEKESNLELAAKFVPMPKREDRKNVEREVEIMNLLQHSLIIQLYAAYEYQKVMCVILELIEGGELFDRVIDDDFMLTEKVCSIFVRQICEAMQFIHQNNILHLDLKPENILCLSRNGNRIKIIDFGLARIYDPDKKLQILFGTPEFVAPEVVNFDNISFGTDMWSVGVISYVLLSGLSPFMGETDIDTMANVTIAKYDFEDEAFTNVSSDALDFISKLLVKDTSLRLSASQCLEHNWLKKPQKLEKLETKPICKTTPSSPPHVIETKSMDTAKENLKNFIERWEEHPNSPYVFDESEGSKVISQLSDSIPPSLVSSRAGSPSPCGSVTTLADELIKTKITQNGEEKSEDNAKKKTRCQNKNESFESYLQSFERRHSDTNYTSSAEKMDLAEEIKKLSNHLLMLSDINQKLENETQTLTKNDKFKSNEKNLLEKSKITTKSKDYTRLGNKTEKSKKTELIQIKSDKIEQKLIKCKKEFNKKLSFEQIEKLAKEQQLENLTNESNGTIRKSKNGFIKHEKMFKETNTTHSGVPWAITNKRTKYRINQMSRDVPIDSPDTHRAFNLQDAARNTKDCLLHLLNKYNETKPNRNHITRHQSISIDYNVSNTLEYKSMNSINAFFQRCSTSGNTVKQRLAQLEANNKKS